MLSTKPLHGTTAAVTGSGRGIGRAIALALAEAGAQVAVVARNGEQVAEAVGLIRAAGGMAIGLTADLCDIDAARGFIAEAEREFGPLDLLVNNAGSHRSVGNPWEVDPDTWWSDIETNLKSAFLCSRFALPAMVARGSGRIQINIASGAGLEPRAHSSAYASAKAAVIRFSESLDAAVREKGIGVFSLHPGGVRTELTEQIMATDEGRRVYPGWADYPWVGPELAAGFCVEIAAGEWDFMSGRYIDAAWPNLDDLKREAPDIAAGGRYTMGLRLPDTLR